MPATEALFSPGVRQSTCWMDGEIAPYSDEPAAVAEDCLASRKMLAKAESPGQAAPAA